MEQIGISFTNAGAPATGLAPLINIWERNGTQRITNGVCKELAGGRYIYDFNEYSNDKVYLYQFDGGNTLSDTDRYKFGGNELDAYSNKYSRGRTAIPVTNYTPNFQKLEKNFKELPKKLPKYDDKELKKLIADVKKIIDSKNNTDVISKLDNVSKEISKLNDTIKSIDVSENIDVIGGAIESLNNSLTAVKDEIKDGMYEVEGMIGERINGFDEKITSNMDNKYTAELLGKPVANLDKKIEDLFMSVMSRKVPEHLLEKFDISLKKKGEPEKSDEETLKELEALVS